MATKGRALVNHFVGCGLGRLAFAGRDSAALVTWGLELSAGGGGGAMVTRSKAGMGRGRYLTPIIEADLWPMRHAC